MSERGTDLTLGVGPPWSFGARCRGRRQDGGRIPRRERKRVMVPSEQRRLQEDCEDAKERRSAARRRQLRLPAQTP